jgi:hypothetical protein
MSFRDEEGQPLVAEAEPKTTTYPRSLIALLCVAVLAATTYVSYSLGRSHALAAATQLSTINNMKATTSLKQFDGEEPHSHLPNDADGPLTNDGAIRSIVKHNFGPYEYLKGKQFDGKFKSAGHGYSLNGSPIPDDPDYEGQHKEVEIHVGFFGGVFKTYYFKGEKKTDKIGEMAGLNKDENIVFIDGDKHAREGVDVPLPNFGTVMVVCGETDKIADYHMHSGHDNRITIHSVEACDHDE